MKSALYCGPMRHRRRLPVTHEFSYPLLMFYLDLDEIDSVFGKHWFTSINKFNLVSFFRKDYFQAEHQGINGLKQSIINRVAAAMDCDSAISTSIVSVRMLTQVRLLNYVFNPVSFYYCFDANDKLLAILTEITNTPWDERHDYVLPVTGSVAGVKYARRGKDKHEFKFAKSFHISPFNPMNMNYRWVFGACEQTLQIHMDCKTIMPNGSDEKHFDATVNLERKSIEHELGKQLIQYPLSTVRVLIGIYWQALKLWLKSTPFYGHPSSTNTVTQTRSTIETANKTVRQLRPK